MAATSWPRHTCAGSLHDHERFVHALHTMRSGVHFVRFNQLVACGYLPDAVHALDDFACLRHAGTDDIVQIFADGAARVSKGRSGRPEIIEADDEAGFAAFLMTVPPLTYWHTIRDSVITTVVHGAAWVAIAGVTWSFVSAVWHR